MEHALAMIRDFIAAQRSRLIKYFMRMAIERVLRNGPTAYHYRSDWIYTVRQYPNTIVALTRAFGEDVVTCVIPFWTGCDASLRPEIDESDLEEQDLIQFAQHELEA